MSCSDAPEPLELMLTHDPDGIDSGAPNVVTLSIGNPPQQLKLTPATTFMNTGVHITPRCGNSSDPGCSGDVYGGIYDSTKSQTYSAASFNTWNGSRDAGQTTFTSTYFNDVVRLSEDDTLTAFPVVTLDTMFDIPNVFGIATNSTMISQAHSAGLITSKSWSVYAGTTTSPGSLILGGYSDEFVEGDMVTGISDPTCAICFQVTAITLDTPQRSVPVLKAGQGTFLAQFEFFNNWLAFPNSVFKNWLDVTNGTVGQQDFASYEADDIPEGDLVFTLNTGINITVPNRDLFTSGTINGNGTVFTPVAGRQIAKIKRSQITTGAFGFPFMSQLYVTYDMERRLVRYSQAAANATSNGKLTKICPLAANGSAPNTNSTLPSTGQSNTGAIAGGVVGGLAILLIAIVAVVFLVLRHRRKQPRNRPGSDSSAMPLEKDAQSAYPLSAISKATQEYPNYRQVTQDPVEAYVRPQVEVQGDTPRYELPSSNMKDPADLNYDRYELPASSPTRGGTMTSWGDTTLSSQQGTGSPIPLSSKVSPLWAQR